jgi:hypothetical protein
MSFSATEAAFEGFRVTRHHPLAVLAWTLLSAIAVVGMLLVAAPILTPLASEFQTIMASGGTVQPSAAFQTHIGYAGLATVPVSLILQAVLLPAIYRAMSRSGGDRFGFVRLGRDELRALGALVIINLVTLIVSQGGELLATLVMASGIGPLALLIETLSLVIGIFVSVRLVLVMPAAFTAGRIDLKAGWQATAGRFWPLLGMAIIAGFMAFVVILLLGVVALPISIGTIGVAASGASGAASTIGAGGLLIIMALATSLSTTILAAPFMTAYREITGQSQD